MAENINNKFYFSFKDSFGNKILTGDILIKNGYSDLKYIVEYDFFSANFSLKSLNGYSSIEFKDLVKIVPNGFKSHERVPNNYFNDENNHFTLPEFTVIENTII